MSVVEPFQVLFNRIEAQDQNHVLVFEDVCLWPIETLEALVRLEVLTPSSPSEYATCSECYQPHQVRHIADEHGLKHPFLECEEHPESGLMPVEKRLLSQWSIHLLPLWQFVAEQLGCRGAVRRLVADRLWHLGRSAMTPATDVCIARGTSWSDATVVFNIPKIQSWVVLTSSDNSTAPIKSIAVPLSSLLYIDQGMLRLDTSNISVQTPSSSGIYDLFEPSQNFRRVIRLRDNRQFTFAPLAAIAIRNLIENHPKKLTNDEVMATSGSSASVPNAFRNNDAWGELVLFDGSGHYWLNP